MSYHNYEVIYEDAYTEIRDAYTKLILVDTEDGSTVDVDMEAIVFIYHYFEQYRETLPARRRPNLFKNECLTIQDVSHPLLLLTCRRTRNTLVFEDIYVMQAISDWYRHNYQPIVFPDCEHAQD